MRNFYDAEASKQLNSGSCWFLQLHAQIIGDGPCSAIDSDGMEIGDQAVTRTYLKVVRVLPAREVLSLAISTSEIITMMCESDCSALRLHCIGSLRLHCTGGLR